MKLKDKRRWYMETSQGVALGDSPDGIIEANFVMTPDQYNDLGRMTELFTEIRLGGYEPIHSSSFLMNDGKVCLSLVLGRYNPHTNLPGYTYLSYS